MLGRNNRWVCLMLSATLLINLSPGIALATDGNYSETGSITVNEPVEISLEKDGRALYSFTPVSDGWYNFASLGDLDAEGTLYSDATLCNVLAHGSDNSDCDYNFSFSCELEAGKTVYLLAYLFSPTDCGVFSISVSSLAPLSLSGAYLNNSTIEWRGGSAITLDDLGIHSIDGSLLIEGEDIVASKWCDSNMTQLAGAPSACGSYSVVIAPSEGSNYSGSATIYFELFNPYDISAAVASANHELVIVDGAVPSSGFVVHNPCFNSNLEAGADYQICAYCTKDTYGTWTNDVASTTGYHCAQIKGQGDYIGLTEAWFYAYDGNSISQLRPNNDYSVDTYACFSLTAESSGYYRLSSSGENRTAVCLYEDRTFSNHIATDDGNSTGNFSLTHYLTKGETVYVLTRLLDNTQSGSFTVSCDYLGIFGFVDTPPDAWYVANGALEFVVSNGIMVGKTANAFMPNANISRAEVARILYCLAEEPTDYKIGEGFTDVKNGAWYYEEVMWAQSQGIISGFEDGSFKPNTPVTREQFAKMLFAFANGAYEIESVDMNVLSNYEDKDLVASWAAREMAWCIDSGIISGYENSTLRPKSNATRAVSAQMIRQFCSL